MRLMLGHNNLPSLLVDKLSDKDGGFDFYVVNGAWDGYFKDGTIIVKETGDTFDGVTILCDNQDRLRGDYQNVFDNFDNDNYSARAHEKINYPALSFNDVK